MSEESRDFKAIRKSELVTKAARDHEQELGFSYRLCLTLATGTPLHSNILIVVKANCQTPYTNIFRITFAHIGSGISSDVK